ncbi:MAG TPA: FecR domain-containing protein [Puia sp.]|jgi:ferric-dicitrate binding protein FerR (iron transport regulator)|nr:FecR domain-containing protein [Puia sp.]
MNVKEAQQFVADYANGEFTPTEHAAFLQWVRGAGVRELELIAEEHETHHGQWVFSTEGPSPEWVGALEDRLDRLAEKRVKAPVVRMPFGKRVWIVAASVAILIIAGTFWYSQTGGSLNKEERQQALATLTQTMKVERGGEQRSVTLPDGSKVWLNVASILKYPVKFSGPDRVVELSGEGYFEVSQRSDMPFRVLIKDAEVKVLGTHFNIMAYDDEPVARTSLIDGSVSVESGSQRVTLHPGEQGEIPYSSPGATGPIKVIPGIDPSAVVAWRDGVLKFEGTPMHELLRTLGRCYDVEIQIDQNVPDTPGYGIFSRSQGLDSIMKQLKRDHLQFITNGKTVRVTMAK